MFCFKDIKTFSLMKEIGAYYNTLQQLKHLKVKKKKKPHKSCIIFGSRMFSTDVHVCISIVLYIYPLTHQCHPFIIFKASGFPSHLYKSMPVFHWNKLKFWFCYLFWAVWICCHFGETSFSLQFHESLPFSSANYWLKLVTTKVTCIPWSYQADGV